MDLTDSLERITPQQFHEMSGVDDWRVIGEGVCAHFRTGSLVAGAGLVQAISEMVGEVDLRPEVDVRHDGVTVRLFVTPDLGLSQRDVTMARMISAVARKLGLPADPSAIQTVQVTIDALARSEVTPFWRAVLGWVERDGPEDLMDPHGRGPAVYFQQMDAPRMQRNRLHIDVYVPYDQAEARITAAIAAGGRLVTDEFAPHWWVLADAEGNEACVATFGWLGRYPVGRREPEHRGRVRIVPANNASWDDLVAILGTSDHPGRCQCQRFKVVGWIWRDSTQEQLARATVDFARERSASALEAYRW